MKFYRDVFWVTLCEIPSTHVDPFKNMAACERVILPYMAAIVQTSKIFFSESV